MTMKVGFIGLGIMGKPMSKNLLKAGYSVVADRNPEAIADVIAAGAETAATAKAIAEQCDVIITMLPNSPHVKEVALGENGIIEGAKPGTVLIDMSSIAPLASREISEALKAKGIDMLDAPVSGGEPKAIDGTLSVMVGGDKAIFDKYYDLMKAMAGSVVHTGEIGAGNVTKLANQVIVALNIAAMSEALTLATKAGVNPDLVYQAIRGGLAGSTLSVDAAVRNMVELTGVTPAEAIHMASLHPARMLGVDGVLGSLKPGKRASVVALDSGLHVQQIWIQGQLASF